MRTMNPIEVLTKAKELLSDPARWTQGEWSRDAKGLPSTYRDAGPPVCWCLRGAITRVAGGFDNSGGAEEIVEEAFRGAPHPGQGERMLFVEWQDAKGRTHAEVMALLDNSIALAQKKSCAPLPLANQDPDGP